MRLLGIDTGGTFTDFVYFDGTTLHARKVLSTPEAPEEAVLQGLRELAMDLAGLHIIHGSTVATNAVLEGKGARVVYVANRGLGDVLTIGRQARRALYDLQPEPPPPPVPAELCLETGGRLDADGAVVEALTEEDIAVLLEQIHALGAESVAVNLLFSFVDDRFEREIARRLPSGLFASISSQVLPEYKEYERGIATWLNAYVGPLMAGYLDRTAARTRPAALSIMRSSGDACGAHQAGREAVHLLLSGPAGGLTGARHCAGQIGAAKCMTFDMGGTSTDVALIDGDIALTNEGRIGPYPVAVPMVDMHSIGAGGGSIAYADAGGGLQVGPQSAGARPGPACYDQGGTLPTVTDANLLLGRLPPFTRLGGTLALNGDKARQALAGLAAELGLATAEQAADGVVALANEHMTQALRLISVQRGIDPRDFVLVAFGGAGGLHVCALAEALEMGRALVPARAGALSAFGMLVAPAGRQYSKTLAVLLEAVAAGGHQSGVGPVAGTGTGGVGGAGAPRRRVAASGQPGSALPRPVLNAEPGMGERHCDSGGPVSPVASRPLRPPAGQSRGIGQRASGPESVAAVVAPARHAGSERPWGRRQQGGDASPWLRRASAVAFPRTPEGASARALYRLRPRTPQCLSPAVGRAELTSRGTSRLRKAETRVKWRLSALRGL